MNRVDWLNLKVRALFWIDNELELVKRAVDRRLDAAIYRWSARRCR